MSSPSRDELLAKKCRPCEGGVQACTPSVAEAHLRYLDRWCLADDGRRIRKQWKFKHFMEAIRFFNRCAELAEAEGHHPDLHLEQYRFATIELWTHAIGGLSENDFILAAKIDQIYDDETP
ncbi:MAG: 4a-hydroxytetrahydrobiopterin dehydratase [Planctomycetales bacterium]|nr:4a-hydroxytetrahydrobiopterin dehydratase [Planctomycetales bacterium]